MQVLLLYFQGSHCQLWIILQGFPCFIRSFLGKFAYSFVHERDNLKNRKASKILLRSFKIDIFHIILMETFYSSFKTITMYLLNVLKVIFPDCDNGVGARASISLLKNSYFRCSCLMSLCSVH